jgi:hypothetical protein
MDPLYFSFVVEAAHGLDTYGMVDLETAALADAEGFTIQTLTADAERYRTIYPTKGFA